MADPTTPDPAVLADTATAADSTAQSLSNMNNAAFLAKDTMSGLSDVVSGIQNEFSDFDKSIGNLNTALNQSGTVTTQQATQFALLSTAVFGSRKAFDSLGNIDIKPLSTITDQVTYLGQHLGNSSTAIGALVSVAEKGFGAVVPDSAKKSISAITGFLGQLTQSADNALRLQNAYVQLAARTGTLNDLYTKAGPNLGNINSLLAAQNDIMSQTQISTGLNSESVEKYYTALASVPKALQDTITGSNGASSRMSMLTATIKLATGTGRDYNDIIKDLQEGFRTYGLTGEKALTFTERFSELSNKFGVELEDVRSQLLRSADAFKVYADAGESASRMSEGLAGISNDYIGVLEKTGMTGQHAVETIGQITNSISGLNIAQKSFLSAQSGGVGGLMGGFQIEKMLRDGKIDEVFDKVRETMQKQFGKIVLLDDATKSPEAANQLEKQTLLLQSGPLGSLAKTPQDAYRILEAFKAKQDGTALKDQGAGGLNARGLQDAIGKGTSLEEKSYTQLTSIRGILDNIYRANESNLLGFAQQASTASAGGGALGAETTAQRNARHDLTQRMSQADQKGSALQSNSGRITADSIINLEKWVKTVPTSLRATMDTVKQAVSSGNKNNIASAQKQLQQEIDSNRKAKEELLKNPSGLNKEELGKEISRLNAQEKVNLKGQGILDNVLNPGNGADIVGTATNRSLNSAQSPNTNNQVARITASGATSSISGNNINVHVTGYCIKCKREIEGSEQSHSTTPGSKVSP